MQDHVSFNTFFSAKILLQMLHILDMSVISFCHHGTFSCGASDVLGDQILLNKPCRSDPKSCISVSTGYLFFEVYVYDMPLNEKPNLII